MLNSKKRSLRDVKEEALENVDFNNLLARLENAKHIVPPDELQKLISRNDLEKLLGYLMRPQDRVMTRRRVQHLNELNEIIALKPNQSYRLDKTETLLPRTLTVLRNRLGEYKLIAETKSKLNDNTKQALEEAAGRIKSGKPAWCLDDFDEYFNLVARLEDDDDSDLNNIKEEVMFSQKLASDHVCEYMLGPEYEKNGQRKVSIYAKKASISLEKFLQKHRLTRAQKNELIRQLLLAVKYFHDHDCIHQDLKLDNVLVFGNLIDGFIIKLTDYGCSFGNGVKAESLSTPEYMSPEIAAFYSRPDSFHHEHFSSEEAKNAFGNQPLARPAPRAWGTPDKANDMWALGVMIFEILHGRLPNDPSVVRKIQRCPLLNGLLQKHRNHRFTIDDAISCHHEQCARASAESSKNLSLKKRKV